MSQIVINYSNYENVAAGAMTEVLSVEDAQDRIEADYPDAVYGDWDADGHNDDGQPMERMLVWADEKSSVNDAGANSICEISRVRS